MQHNRACELDLHTGNERFQGFIYFSPLPPQRAKEVRKTHGRQVEEYAAVLGLDNRVDVGGALDTRAVIGRGRGRRDTLDIDRLIDCWLWERAWLPGIDWQNGSSSPSTPGTRLDAQSDLHFGAEYPRRAGVVTGSGLRTSRGVVRGSLKKAYGVIAGLFLGCSS